MTDKEIARFSAPVIQAYRDMEDELLRLIAKQIMKDKNVSDTSAWRIRQLARAGEINQQALAIIDSYAGGISSEIAEAILAAAEGEVGTLDAAMLNLLSEKGKMTDEQRNMLDAFQRQSRQELNIENARIAESYAQALQEDCNLVNTVMGYQTASAYSECVREIADELDRQAVINELNQGSMSVVSGTESLQEATRRTLERLAVKGIPGFIDKAGREWSPEAYVKMDLRSTMGNTARAAQDARCDRYGIQLIEVSSHNGARPKCAPYQGRIFSRNGTAGTTTDLEGNRISYIPLSQTSYGEPDGLFGINCGHQQYPFIPGVSMRTYYPYPEEQNAERYQQTQQQRAMERKIRADKRKCMMMQETGDDEGLRKAAGKLRADKGRYRDFCKETGLGAHLENTQVYGYDRSKSMKTVWAGRTKGSGNGGSAADSTNAGVMNMVTPNTIQQNIGGIKGYNGGNALTGSGGSGIIKGITVDSFEPAVKGGVISEECRDTILNTLKSQGVLSVYDEVRVINLPANKDGKIEPLRTNAVDSPGYPRVYFEINEAYFGGRSKESVDEGFRLQNYCIANSLEEAVIHECGHAKVIRNKTYEAYVAIDEELKGDAFTKPIQSREDKKSLRDLAGEISEYAKKDGLECISECHVKLDRGEEISEELQALHDKYVE